MKVSFPVMTYIEVTHIEVDAGVRYWEDSTVNGNAEDDDEPKIFGAEGDRWKVRINLDEGKIEDWPEGMTAEIHYKVCDDGIYWLTDGFGTRLLKREDYVPNDFLCHSENGFGDYIIMDVSEEGYIQGYQQPEFDPDMWERA